MGSRAIIACVMERFLERCQSFRCFDPDHWEVYWDYSAIEYSFEEDDNSDVKIDHIEEPSESSSPICQEELEDIIELVDKAIFNSQSRASNIDIYKDFFIFK